MTLYLLLLAKYLQNLFSKQQQVETKPQLTFANTYKHLNGISAFLLGMVFQSYTKGINKTLCYNFIG